MFRPHLSRKYFDVNKNYLLIILYFIFSNQVSFTQQICFDGSYCPFPGGVTLENGSMPAADPSDNSCMYGGTDEYGSPLAEGEPDPGVDGNAGGTCDILYYWIAADGSPFIYLALLQGNSGTATYQFFFDTDNDSATGDLTNPAAGAEIRLTFGVTQAGINSQEVDQWDGTTWVTTSSNNIMGLAGTVDGCGGSEEVFIEVQMPIADLFDVCDPSNSGQFSFTGGQTFAGGNTNSAVCDFLLGQITIEVPSSPIANLSPVSGLCGPDVSTIFDASGSSGGAGLTYSWDFGDGTNLIGSDMEAHSFAMSGTYTVCVTVQDPTFTCPANGLEMACTDVIVGDGLVASPIITVTDNMCDPDVDGFYTISTPCADGSSIEYSTDGGLNWGIVLPTYPTAFITRCVGELCEIVDLTGLDTSNDAVDEVNGGNVTIGAAQITIAQSFDGSSTLDENEITAGQTTGDIGISSGVSHNCVQDSCGQLANAMNNLYNFSLPVCNLTIDIWDIDRDDEMILFASGPNGPVSYSINTIGTGVTYNGITFASNNPNVNYPTLPNFPATLGMFSITFDDCITQIDIDYYDASNTAGDGGSYTIVFQEGCTITECVSDEVQITPNPIECPVCLEDIVANFTIPANACSDSSVTFDASNTTGIDRSFVWDFDGDGVTDLITSTPTASYTYTTTGIFTAILIVNDPMGLCDSDTTSMTIEICNTVAVSCPTNDVTVIPGMPIDTASIGGPIFGATACSDASIIFSDLSTPGSCPIVEVIRRTFTITDDCGSTSCTQTITIEGTPPVLNAAPLPSEICLGTTIDLNASASTGSNLTYCWDIDYDGVTVNCDYTTAMASHTYNLGGTYDIYLAISDDIGCEEIFVYTITIFTPPVKVATVTFDECDLTITYDASGSMDNHQTNNLIYNWTFSDGSTSIFPSGVVTLNSCDDVGLVSLEIIDPDITNAACNSDGMTWTFTPDMTPPVLVCPPTVDIDCGDPFPSYSDESAFIAAGGTASDNCSIVTFNIIATDTIPAACPYSAAVEVTYEALDICGNSSQCAQMFNLIAPLPDAIIPPNLILSCGDDIDTSATGSPNVVESFCALDVTIIFEDELISGSCPGDVTIIRSFTLTDQCGNQSTGDDFTQTINIVNDIPPLLQLPPDTIIECTSACDPSATGGIAQAIDFCMPIDGTVNEVTISWQDTISGFDGTIYPDGVIGFIIRIFTAVDACGNTSSGAQKIGIRGGDSILTCNDRINISIAEDCSGITPDFLLEDPGDTKYIIILDDGQVGYALGSNQLFQWIDWSAYFGNTDIINYKIVDFCGNSCWGEIRIEANTIPEYTSPCSYTPGNNIIESGELDQNEELNLWDVLGIDEYPERKADYLGTVALINPDCQDPIFSGTSNFLFTEDIPSKEGIIEVEFAELVLILINTTDGSAYTYNFLTGEIPDTPLVDLIAHPGIYDVYVSSNSWLTQGTYSIKIDVNSCLPISECSSICQGDRPDPYITVEEILADFDTLCYAPIIGDITVERYTEGDMCEGLIHVETYYASVQRHGIIEKIEIISQAYFENKLDLDDFEILAPNNVTLDCNDPYAPEDIYEITEDKSNAYPFYFDFNTIVKDSICAEEAIIHIIASQDTVQEMVNFGGLWTLVDVVKKSFRDSIVCLRKIPNPEIQYKKILLMDDVCNVIISYEDSEIEGCAGGKKVFREWSVIDWCESTSIIKLIQNIEITDTEAPKIKKYDDVTVGIDPWACAATYKIPDINGEDNCGNDYLSQTWHIVEGKILDGYILDLWIDNSPVEAIIQIKDDCGNEVFDTINIIVEDRIAPVPVCIDNLTVILTSSMLNSDDGGGKIYAPSFDQGSHDAGCGPVDVLVRRMEGCCLTECKTVYECTESDPKSGICIDSVAVDLYDDFGDFVKFCCGDVNSIVSVEILVSDKSGNTNYCWVDVFVDDKTQASLVCENYEVECTEDLAGMPGAKPSGQVCTPAEDRIELLLESGVDGSCGLDQIIREWYIDRDNSGDFTPGDAYCEQVITIQQNENNFDPYTIKWPKHYTGEVMPGINLECEDDEVMTSDSNVQMGDVQLCGINDEDFHYPVWCVTDCGLVASNVQTDTIFSSDACFKLINRWTVIDWCKWNANSTSLDDENDNNSDSFVAVEDWAQGVCADCPDYGAPINESVYFKYTDVQVDGYYTFDQVIKVIDDQAPELTVAEVHNVSTSGGASSKDDGTPCVGAGSIIATASDFCDGSETSADKLLWDIIITVNDEVIDARTARGASVEINLSELHFRDMIEIEWIVADGCGNSTTTTTMVVPEDDRAPTPFCIGGISTTLSNEETSITVWASELDFGSFDNCTDADDLKFAIVYRDEVPILPGEDGFDDQAGMVFDCAVLGNIIDVNMWVFDAQGNGDFCSGAINIQGNCEAPVDTTAVEPPVDTTSTNTGTGSFIIAGHIMNEYSVPIENTEVKLNANLSEYPKTWYTANDGAFLFGNNPSNVNYNIEAIKNNFHENGVTTLDILLIQRHILDLQRLDSPYKIIAADANNDQRVTIADVVDTRSLILGVVAQFPNNSSWTFAKEGQSFPSQINPWPYISINDIRSLDGAHMNEDFVGIKVGDVNNTAATNDIKAAERRFLDNIDFVVSIPSAKQNSIQFKASDISQLYGMQFTLTIADQEIIGVTSNNISITPQNYHASQDMLTFSWNETEAIDGELSFEVILADKLRSKMLLDIEIHSEVTPIEAYIGEALDIVGIDFIIEEKANDIFAIYQNTPNPFTDRTEIEFYNPADDLVKITIFDAEGKMIYEEQDRFTPGHHKLTITSAELKSNGVYYYQIATSENIQSIKMVRSD